MKAKRICAWCKEILGYAENKTGNDTHGICEKCLDKQPKRRNAMRSKELQKIADLPDAIQRTAKHYWPLIRESDAIANGNPLEVAEHLSCSILRQRFEKEVARRERDAAKHDAGLLRGEIGTLKYEYERKFGELTRRIAELEGELRRSSLADDASHHNKMIQDGAAMDIPLTGKAV